MHHPIKTAIILLLVLLPIGRTECGVRFDKLVQTYDGGPSYPEVTVDGAAYSPLFACRLLDPSSTQVTYSNIPAALALSYTSLSFSAQQTSELGNFIQLSGGNRVADYIEVVMVTWASASKYPEWAVADPTGYRQPLTARIYQPVTAPGGGTAFQIVEESTVHVHVPWKPTLLPTGVTYPYNGYAFRVIIPFSGRISVPDSCVLSIAYQTQSSGSAPIGSPGPYNELNVALSAAKPVTGTDPDPSAVFWIKNDQWFYPATGWGGVGSPMITIRTRPSALPSPVLRSSVTPIHPGTYHLNASITSPAAEASAVLRISKATATIQAVGLERSVVDPPTGPILTTDPPGLPFQITFGGSTALPTTPGAHPFEASVNTLDHEGTLKGIFILTAERYEQWIEKKMPSLPAILSSGSSDPDGDGRPNAFEYATGSNPLASDPAILPQRVAGGLRITYPFRRGMDRVEVHPEFSADLRTWSAPATITEQNGDLWETRAASVNQTHGFFRFRTSNPESR